MVLFTQKLSLDIQIKLTLSRFYCENQKVAHCNHTKEQLVSFQAADVTQEKHSHQSFSTLEQLLFHQRVIQLHAPYIQFC